MPLRSFVRVSLHNCFRNCTCVFQITSQWFFVFSIGLTQISFFYLSFFPLFWRPGRAKKQIPGAGNGKVGKTKKHINKANICKAKRGNNKIALREKRKLKCATPTRTVVYCFPDVCFQCVLFWTCKTSFVCICHFRSSFLAPRPRKTKQQIQELAMKQ